jgi:acyl carrier protein
VTEPFAEEVIAALAKVKRIPQESIALDSTLQSLRMDSLDTITLLFELEDAFGVKIPDEAARGIRTVADIVDGIRRLKTQAASAGASAASESGHHQV